MPQVSRFRRIYRTCVFALPLFFAVAATAADDPGETLREPVLNDDFVIREEMIPMRDGVKLYTIIMVPKDGGDDLPIIMNRTPYDATGILRGPASTRLGVNIGTQFLGDDYIYVAQDIRGRFESEGEYIMFRPPRGPFNDTETDHTTDLGHLLSRLAHACGDQESTSGTCRGGAIQSCRRCLESGRLVSLGRVSRRICLRVYLCDADQDGRIHSLPLLEI